MSLITDSLLAQMKADFQIPQTQLEFWLRDVYGIGYHYWDWEPRPTEWWIDSSLPVGPVSHFMRLKSTPTVFGQRIRKPVREAFYTPMPNEPRLKAGDLVDWFWHESIDFTTAESVKNSSALGEGEVHSVDRVGINSALTYGIRNIRRSD